RRLAAARLSWLRLRSAVPAGRLRSHLRRDDSGGETRPAAARPRPVASRPRLRETCRRVLAEAIIDYNFNDLSAAEVNACFSRGASRPKLVNMNLPNPAPFAVYVHWPFCLSKCPYCDFNSHVRHGGYDEARYVRAIETELASTAQRVPGRTVSTIFFGGGTPSLMQPTSVQAILDAIARHWSVSPDVEVTLEANPTSVEATRFRGYRAAGVNRVSLGVQALDDASLKELGRLHSAQEALDAVAVARSIFDRYSFDLIYARPRQSPQAWAAELKLAVAEAAEHLSLYQLTVEQETPFAALHKNGKLVIPNDDAARELYDLTQEICAAAGLPAYEVSNHARPGAECRHNLVYWRGHEYAGIGPGAHG